LVRERQQKRTRFDTIYEILQLCIQTKKKTHIMYQVNLSHSQLEKHLSILIRSQLLAVDDEGYLTTERGKYFIEKFKELNKLIETDNPRNKGIRLSEIQKNEVPDPVLL
jgi:predicted transcriptional regulator